MPWIKILTHSSIAYENQECPEKKYDRELVLIGNPMSQILNQQLYFALVLEVLLPGEMLTPALPPQYTAMY
jgi:hypothetical protein